MRVLDEKQIKQKIVRLAYEIAEQNYAVDEIILLGINNNGLSFAKLIYKELNKIAKSPITVNNILLNPADPTSQDINHTKPLPTSFNNKSIIIVDDVANTGRTIFYAFKPFMELTPYKIEVAVLVDRKHKHFPIHVDYVGLSLATTLMENIEVRINDVDEMEVHLV